MARQKTDYLHNTSVKSVIVAPTTTTHGRSTDKTARTYHQRHKPVARVRNGVGLESLLPTGSYSFEDVQAMAVLAGVTYDSYCCGYLRLPFSMKANNDGGSITGFCALNNTRCTKSIARDAKWSVDLCQLYVHKYGGNNNG
jgi:hypothetical protein